MKNPAWRVLTNRANAANSTGPKTEEGKAVSSRNATKHALTSKQIVIPGEDPAEYDALRANLISDLKPANSVECDLVEELAAGSWRLKRAYRIETAVLAKIAGDSPDPDAAIAASFLERPKELDRLIRYITSIERAYWKAFNKLEAIQKARREQEHEEAMKQSYLESLKQPEVARTESVGFVSQNTETAVPEPAPALVQTAGGGR